LRLDIITWHEHCEQHIYSITVEQWNTVRPHVSAFGDIAISIGCAETSVDISVDIETTCNMFTSIMLFKTHTLDSLMYTSHLPQNSLNPLPPLTISAFI
jgi:hypothetical protein